MKPFDWKDIEARADAVDAVVASIIKKDESLYMYLQFGDELTKSKAKRYAPYLPILQLFFDRYANMYEAY